MAFGAQNHDFLAFLQLRFSTNFVLEAKTHTHERKTPNCFSLTRYTPYLLTEPRDNDTLVFRWAAGASWLELVVTGPPWHKVANQCQSGPPWHKVA